MVAIHLKSTEHPDFPVIPKVVRGETLLNGYQLEEIVNA